MRDDYAPETFVSLVRLSGLRAAFEAHPQRVHAMLESKYWAPAVLGTDRQKTFVDNLNHTDLTTHFPVPIGYEWGAYPLVKLYYWSEVSRTACSTRRSGQCVGRILMTELDEIVWKATVQKLLSL